MQRQSMIGSGLLAQDVIYETRCNVDEDPTKVSRGLKNTVVLDNIENIIVCIHIQIHRDHLANIHLDQGGLKRAQKVEIMIILDIIISIFIIWITVLMMLPIILIIS